MNTKTPRKQRRLPLRVSYAVVATVVVWLVMAAGTALVVFSSGEPAWQFLVLALLEGVGCAVIADMPSQDDIE